MQYRFYVLYDNDFFIATGTEDNINSVAANGMSCADFDYPEIGSVMQDSEHFKSPPERVIAFFFFFFALEHW